MVSIGYTEIILSVVALLFLYTLVEKKRGHPWNWPILGMLPSFLSHFYRIHDKFSELLQQNAGTFFLKGVWFTDTDVLFTSDPANANYILSTNFDNYGKGHEAKVIFDVHGDILFNADHDEWRGHRKLVRAFFNDPRCIQATRKLVRETLENGLLPVLDHICEKNQVVDLQDLFTRLMLDSTCTLVTGYNPETLCIGFPKTEIALAMDIANDRIFQRHFLPQRWWKLQRWLGVGEEKKMAQAIKTLNEIAAKFIKMKREDIKGNVEGFDALKFFMVDGQPSNFLRDIVVVFNAGGRDTTGSALAWIFWLLSQNPSVESKMRDELDSILSKDEVEKSRIFDVEELKKLPYLHGVICETLRLYPPAPYQQRVPVKPDTLPSGHRVHPKMEIFFSWYALGRDPTIWGEDVLEFKPERWISDKVEIRHDLVNKLLFAFSAGPRICPGKNDAFTRMKAVVASMVYNYDVHVVKDHPITAAISIGLRMNHGLMVNITKKWN